MGLGNCGELVLHILALHLEFSTHHLINAKYFIYSIFELDTNSASLTRMFRTDCSQRA